MPFYSASLIETVQVSYFLLSFLIKNIFGLFSIFMHDNVTENLR